MLLNYKVRCIALGRALHLAVLRMPYLTLLFFSCILGWSRFFLFLRYAERLLRRTVTGALRENLHRLLDFRFAYRTPTLYRLFAKIAIAAYQMATR